ncbi:UNVERIFIED_CONTAM: hypothetical protein C7383_103241 [Murimonas intestini]|uniref:Uncharacterized protein n=1 Tax=Murimonas intestini TaxID=1337051 RepID=A0AB73T6Z4_9FIRM
MTRQREIYKIKDRGCLECVEFAVLLVKHVTEKMY